MIIEGSFIQPIISPENFITIYCQSDPSSLLPTPNSKDTILQNSIELLQGPDKLPHRPIQDFFSKHQPAWLKILEINHIIVTLDGQTSLRLFIPGTETPQILYNRFYSLLRLCLQSCLPKTGSPLQIAVYSYTFNSEKKIYHLSPQPFSFHAKDFPSSNKKPINLDDLNHFFKQNLLLEGAILHPDKGLILFGKKTKQTPTLHGHPITLADFSTAFRAVFHSGKNYPYVSLDPHQNPTLVHVNFGGFLEDTAIGHVLLQSDKRFKTIASGLDPNTHQDIRKQIRTIVPDFLTNAERDFYDNTQTNNNWVRVRFWFYPESVSVATDPNHQYAKILKPQFLADAERTSPNEDHRQIDNSTQANIDHLNKNFFQFTKLYPEFYELTQVARLMGICVWLKNNPYAAQFDLDALLNIPIPNEPTPRILTQFLAASAVLLPKDNYHNLDLITSHTISIYLSSILDQKFEIFFKKTEDIALFLCFKNKKPKESYVQFLKEAKKYQAQYKNRPLREIVHTETDLFALSSYTAHRLIIPSPAIVQQIHHSIAEDKKRLEEIYQQAEATKQEIEEHQDQYSEHLKSYQNLVQEYESVRQRINQNIAQFNTLQLEERMDVIISGGIDLSPSGFTIVQDSSQKSFQEIIRYSKNHKTSTIHSPEISSITPSKWQAVSTQNKGIIKTETFKNQNQQYNLHQNLQQGSWQSVLSRNQQITQKKQYNAKTQALHIAQYQNGTPQTSWTLTHNQPNQIICTYLGTNHL